MNDIWMVGDTIKDAEKKIIERALRFFSYNKTMTARSLGISLRGLDGKMEKLGLNISDLRSGSETKNERATA